MNIHTKGNIPLTQALSDYVAKRLGKIKKIVGSDPSVHCDVDLSRTTMHQSKGDVFRAEIHIVGASKNVFAASEQEDLYAAVDEASDEILAELKAKKQKRLSFVRRGGTQVKAMMKGLWPWGRRG